MRLRLAILAAVMLLPGATLAQDATPSGTVREAPTPAVAVERAEAEAETGAEMPPTLDDLLWVARPLVVFADSANDPRFQQQVAELETRIPEFEDRRVVVLTDTDPAARGPLRQELRPRGFGVVLIDTDGTVVQRRPSVTTAREILNLIDRLPSRRQETGSRRP
jgi:hypothetical protein